MAHSEHVAVESTQTAVAFWSGRFNPPENMKSTLQPSTRRVIAAAAVALVLAVVVGGGLVLNGLRDPHRAAVAQGERIIAQHLAGPLAMSDHIQTPASYFKQITQFPAWQAVPIGFQTFRNVPLQIDGMICLYGEGNAKMGLKFPEAWPGIPLHQKFETLYVYHAAFFWSPAGTPVYDLVFRYEDGSSATNELLYGTDVLDWYADAGKPAAGPTAGRSKLAWHGVAGPGAKNQPLRFCLTAVENPFPDTTVATVDLYSCKNRSAACILALTPGRSGLMR
jgi:hypothetical protein